MQTQSTCAVSLTGMMMTIIIVIIMFVIMFIIIIGTSIKKVKVQ